MINIFSHSQPQALQYELAVSTHLDLSSALQRVILMYNKVTAQELTLYTNKNSNSSQNIIYGNPPFAKTWTRHFTHYF